MDDKLKADISKIIDEAVLSRISNQQATLTFNMENIDAEDRLKKMLNVDKYDMALWDFSQFLRKVIKYFSQKMDCILNFLIRINSNTFHSGAVIDSCKLICSAS